MANKSSMHHSNAEYVALPSTSLSARLGFNETPHGILKTVLAGKRRLGLVHSAFVVFTLLYALDSMAQIPNDFFPINLEFNSGISGAQGTETSAINAVHALEKAQEMADQHYSEKRYGRAFRMYQKLAEAGDKFSQYRMAFMYQHGYGVKQDMELAFIWSYLAAETGDPGFVQYHKQVRERMNDQQLDRAKPMAVSHLRQFGTFAQAVRAKELISKELRKCSGSRTGNTCHKVRASGWKCGLASADGLPAPDCMMLGMVGLPGFAGLHPADIRVVQRNLGKLQDMYAPGEVEIGELRVLEDS